MARKGDRAKNAKRERARLAKTPPRVDLYEDSSDIEADEQEMVVDLWPCGCRIVQRLRFDERKTLTFFAIMWIDRGSLGTWIEQYSCDTGHGYYHEHVSGHRMPGDRRNIRPLYAQVDVQECFDLGYDRVQDRHDRDCRRDR